MYKILIVEDSSESFELVRRALGHSYQIDWVQSQETAIRALESKIYDLALLDINLPDGDGFQLCSLMQTHQDLKGVAVIFLTARDTSPDKVMGFSVGADDFLTKPFEPIELKARVEAKLRRRERDKVKARVLHVGDVEINKDSQKVSFLSPEGQTISLDLTPIEYKIFLLLASGIDQVYSRDDLLTAVWGENVYVYSRSVDTHVSKLRKKLGSRAAYIQSIHGTGYRFCLDDYNQNREAVEFTDSSLRSGTHPL